MYISNILCDLSLDLFIVFIGNLNSPNSCKTNRNTMKPTKIQLKLKCSLTACEWNVYIGTRYVQLSFSPP